jgi:hypothetical protein
MSVYTGNNHLHRKLSFTQEKSIVQEADTCLQRKLSFTQDITIYIRNI